MPLIMQVDLCSKARLEIFMTYISAEKWINSVTGNA